MDLLVGSSLGAVWGIVQACLVLIAILSLDPEYAPARAFLLLLFYVGAASVLGGSVILLGSTQSRFRKTFPSLPARVRNCVSTLLVGGFCLQTGNLLILKALGSGEGMGSLETGVILTVICMLMYGAVRVRPLLEVRITRPVTFFVLGATGISFLLVGALFLNEEFLPRLLSPISLLGNLLFVGSVGLLFGVPMQRLLRADRPVPALRGPGIHRVAIPAAGAFGLVVVAAATLTGAPFFRKPGWPAAGPGDLRRAPDGGLPPVILIVIDTLRADHLPTYGYPRPTSPNLDRFARDAMLYRNAVSPSSWTLPAHASIFTGRYPSAHGADFIEGEDTGSAIPDDASERVETTSPVWPLAETAQTMAEILGEAGYRTAGIVSNYSFLHRAFGCHQGFQHYDDRMRRTEFLSNLAPFRFLRGVSESAYAYQVHRKYRRAGEITRSARKYLRRIGQEPFFLFLNYMEPHAPYNPPGRYRKGIPEPLAGHAGVEEEVLSGARDLPPSHREHLVSLYDGEIAYMDAELGRLFRALESRGLYDRSLIIVTADHGEFFGEHRLMFHGCGLYEEVLHVPLLVKFPGSIRKGSHDAPVSTVDILPTVLSWTGRSVPEDLDGRVLGDPPRPIVSEQYRSRQLAESYGERFDRSERSIRSENLKLIVRSDGSRELYDLAADPDESRNLAGGNPDLVEMLSRWLPKPMESTPSTGRIPPGLDAESVERLRTLGYL